MGAKFGKRRHVFQIFGQEEKLLPRAEPAAGLRFLLWKEKLVPALESGWRELALDWAVTFIYGG